MSSFSRNPCFSLPARMSFSASISATCPSNVLQLEPSIPVFKPSFPLFLVFVSEYEIVSPYEVTHQGHYISHEVGHHHRRRRRSLTPDTSSTNDGGGETVHFRLNGLGQDFHMELQESSDSLIAPGFTIQVLGTNGTKSLRAYQKHDLCFYQGLLRSRVNSSVALSTCMGMVSLNTHRMELRGGGGCICTIAFLMFLIPLVDLWQTNQMWLTKAR